MSSNTVIVFGPTGDVGSFTAITAQQHGAKVWLAMRDTSKPVPGLNAEQEKQQGFERVQADLTKAESVTAAVEKSGARRAFMYLAHGAPDHMEATIKALKAASIEKVVFLSSYTVNGDPAAYPKEEFIPYIHAQVELKLEAILGPDGYVAIRPGAFASNSKGWYGKDVRAGEVKLYAPDLQFDWTTPEDMGGVAGTILANGPKNGQKIVYVAGPEFLKQKDAVDIVIKETASKPVKVTVVTDPEEAIKNSVARGMPEFVARYIVTVMGRRMKGDTRGEFSTLEEAQQNVQTYCGRPGTTFKDWVIKHQAEFQ